MASKFKIGNSGKKTLGEKADILENKSQFDFRQVLFEKIKVNEKNFYNVEDVEELSKSIKENGLMHNIEVLEVIENDNKYYKILSGERRYQAIKKLRELGERFDTIPCKVIKGLNEIDEEIHLIKGNSDTRIISEEERRIQIKRLNELYKLKGEVNGKKINAKKEIAKELQISERSVERYNNINNKLIEPLQEFFDKKLISMTDASKFSLLDQQVQLAILDLLQTQSKVSKEEVEVLKAENKKLIEDRDSKEQKLKEKELAIVKIKLEKSKLNDESKKIVAEKNKLENEMNKIEKSIKEKMENEKLEEVSKLKEEFEALRKQSSELVEQEKKIKVDLEQNNSRLEEQIKELKSKLVLEEKKSNLLVKEKVIQEKINDVKNTIIQDIVSISDLIKVNSLQEVGEVALSEIEKALSVLRNRINEK